MTLRPISYFTLLSRHRSTMETDSDLPTLVLRRDHVNVLRYIRLHQLREPDLVLKHGKAIVGADLSRRSGDDLVRLAVVEQMCLAAVDKQDHEFAQLCLTKLKEEGVSKDSSRFRLLLARCLEGSGDADGAALVYESMLKDNGSNQMALKRKYCILKSEAGKTTAAVEALNEYLKQNYNDSTAWYELANLRKELGDFSGAAFGLVEVLLSVPNDPKIHCELAECYATMGGLDNLGLARKHMAQALELDCTLRRAQFGLVTVSNAYLVEVENSASKHTDEFEVQVATALVQHGADLLDKSYKGNKMFPAVKRLMSEYTAK